MHPSTKQLQQYRHAIKTICILFILCLSQRATSQKIQANNWFFGDHYGLNFSNGNPQTDYNSSIYTYEACTTVSDMEGNLLFYTNGGGRANQAISGLVWNKNHEIMEGGNLGFELGGGYSAAQGAVAFKKPGNQNIYCLITVDEFESISNSDLPDGKGCQYFEIDMDANGGLGEVLPNHQKLMPTSFEYMGATMHASCEDYWLIAPTGHYALEDDPSIADSFYVFRITETGPLLTHIIPMPEGRPDTPDEYGLIKITPDGKHFTCGSHLYTFDNETGDIEHKLSLLDEIGMTEIGPRGFSSNSRYLYQFNSLTFDSTVQLTINQYDLSESEFMESGELIGQIILAEYTIIGSPQLAPDGKLYFLIQEGSFTSPTTLAVIENPNVKGIGANPNYNLLTISNVPDNRFLSFGNFPDNIFKYDPTIPHDLGEDIEIACELLDSVSLVGPENMDTYLWSTGSLEQNITASEPGVYWIEFWVDCEMGADTLVVALTNDLFEVDLGEDTTFCQNETWLLEPELISDATYLWQDGTSTFEYEIIDPGIYWLEVQQKHCVAIDSITIYNDLPPQVNMGPDLVICENEEIRIFPTSTRALSFEWQDGSTKPYFDANEKGTYQLTVSNECGSDTDELILNVFQCDPCNIFVPNAFSPNKDGSNDGFQVLSNCEFIQFDLQIYDRWGNQVYGSINQQDTWDGLLKGRDCPTGVYAFILKIKWLNKFGIPQDNVQTGDILLIR